MKHRNNIAATLADNWKPHKVVVSCNDCGCEIYSPDTMPGNPGSFAGYIVDIIKQHNNFSGHIDFDVEIWPEKPVKEIDVEITVQ